MGSAVLDGSAAGGDERLAAVRHDVDALVGVAAALRAEALAVGVRAAQREHVAQIEEARRGRWRRGGAGRRRGLCLGDVELVAALRRGPAVHRCVPHHGLDRVGRDRAEVPVRDHGAVGLVQQIDGDARRPSWSRRRGRASPSSRRRTGRAAARCGPRTRRRAAAAPMRRRLRVGRDAAPSALRTWTRPLRAPAGTIASTCALSRTAAGADTSSALPRRPMKTTCVTSLMSAPRTRTELPGRAVVSEPQPVRHVIAEAVAGIEAAVAATAGRGAAAGRRDGSAEHRAQHGHDHDGPTVQLDSLPG